MPDDKAKKFVRGARGGRGRGRGGYRGGAPRGGGAPHGGYAGPSNVGRDVLSMDQFEQIMNKPGRGTLVGAAAQLTAAATNTCA